MNKNLIILTGVVGVTTVNGYYYCPFINKKLLNTFTKNVPVIKSCRSSYGKLYVEIENKNFSKDIWINDIILVQNNKFVDNVCIYQRHSIINKPEFLLSPRDSTTIIIDKGEPLDTSSNCEIELLYTSSYILFMLGIATPFLSKARAPLKV